MTKRIGQYEIHPLAELFPPMPDDQYQALKADIAENGQSEDIIIWQDKLIDGRHRLRACLELGIQPDTAELDDSCDPYIYVITHNLHRRHLTESQRSMVAARLATLKRGDVKTQRDSSDLPIGGPSIEDAAKLLSVGERSVARAKQVIEHGSKAIVDAVESGEIPVSFAAKFVTEEPDKKTQAELVAQGKKAMREHITEPSPYVQMSLDGKWISLASAWLKDHCPCTVTEYFVGVSKLMPLHINKFRQSENPKMATAQAALHRCLKMPCFSQQGEMILFLGSAPSEFDDDQHDDSAVEYIRKRWSSWSDLQRQSVRVWIDEQLAT
jgi:hypothetical protein